MGVQEEIVTFEALERCSRLSSKANHFEHVLEYIVENQRAFKTNKIIAAGKENRPDVKVSLDTIADYQVIKRYYSYFVDTRNLSISDIIEFWDKNGF